MNQFRLSLIALLWLRIVSCDGAWSTRGAYHNSTKSKKSGSDKWIDSNIFKGMKRKGKGNWKGAWRENWKGKGRGMAKATSKGNGKGKGKWKGKGEGKGKSRKMRKSKKQTTFPPSMAPSTETSCSTCQAGCLSITDIVVVNADSTFDSSNPVVTPLFSILDGRAYSISNLQVSFDAQNFAVLCIAATSSPSYEVGSVGLRDNNFDTHVDTPSYDLTRDFNVQNEPPYALADFDASNGGLRPTNFSVGFEWSITCQAFCEVDLLGDSSALFTRNFTMIP